MRLIFLFWLSNVYGLLPSRMPNGNIKKYVHHTDINKELLIVDYKYVSLISWNWLSNILGSYNLENNPDYHIITKINRLEGLSQDENLYTYMVWKPKCIYGSSDVLFIIVSELIDNKYNIKLVIQSPFWCSEQIESNELKNILIEYTDDNIDLDELYDSDLRYRLSWYTWCLGN